MKSLFKHIDCLELYTPDLEAGINYYCNHLGLKIIWKTETAVGLGMSEGLAELVLQNERTDMNTDIKVDSVVEAVKEIEEAGGEIIFGPFDIQIGKCAVVKDPWGNQYVILDSSKGLFITDEEGNIVGQEKVQGD